MGSNMYRRFNSTLAMAFVLITIATHTEAKKRKDPMEESRYESDRSKLFEGLQDPETSAQAINPAAIQNPLLQNQALYNNPALANLGGGVFSNQAALGGFNGVGNPYLNSAAAGFRNPYLGLGGLDIYTQGALAAQLYNNPLYGAGASTLSGTAAGINPLLLRGAQNTQYPAVVGGLNNPYLAAQALLSPYANYNQLHNFPFSSRFGIGAGTGRSALSSRYNSRNNNDE